MNAEMRRFGDISAAEMPLPVPEHQLAYVVRRQQIVVSQNLRGRQGVI
jgi:hypothetical protein